MHMHQLSLFLFHRDLRLHDNIALVQALRNSATVVPIFIFDPAQLENNPYRSEAAVQFLCTSLYELSNELRSRQAALYVLHGDTKVVIETLLQQLQPTALYSSRDYTSFSRQRDSQLADLCKVRNVQTYFIDNLLLCNPDTIKTGQGTPYTVFTPFKRTVLQREIARPIACTEMNFYTGSVPNAVSVTDAKCVPYTPVLRPSVTGGRTEGLALLERAKTLVNYAAERDVPSIQGTSLLAAHHKFGTISIRETFHAILQSFSIEHSLISELIWRDFFTGIGYHFPHVFSGAFHQKYNALPWSKSTSMFDAWKSGNTGFPIVDAGMRELRMTGAMHNRVRMIAASFLVKDLHIDWRLGERYFASQLVDYDPAVNNGNWQWSASTGCDAQPYFRIFNPWLQQKRYDPQAEYIRTWVPELQAVPLEMIHTWAESSRLYPDVYTAPICDHSIESAIAKDMYARAAK